MRRCPCPQCPCTFVFSGYVLLIVEIKSVITHSAKSLFEYDSKNGSSPFFTLTLLRLSNSTSRISSIVLIPVKDIYLFI